ncbi:MAG: ATP-grasp domain-containing protein [Synechococcaceae cyanobacterium SM2_3_1]|nr:ATP-grasp domain-containing protein [Synechococcaceae cyanobacterium SM2_3_1]
MLDSSPLVVLANTSEAYASFLNSISNKLTHASLLRRIHCSSDRALLWLNSEKLVIGSLPICHHDLLSEIGYAGTKYLSPSIPTQYLCADIIHENHIIAAIDKWAGASKKIQLIPYANTNEFYQLVSHLREKIGLTVYTPESPNQESLWITHYVDSKFGFRNFVASLDLASDIRLPKYYICKSKQDVIYIASLLLKKRKRCVVKVDDGCLGLGQVYLYPQDLVHHGIERKLADSLIGNYCYEQLIVEEFIESSRFPSIEVFVPPETSSVQVTYVCDQRFDNNLFSGIILTPDLYHDEWYPSLYTFAKKVGEELQGHGYVGYFDIDALIDSHNHIYVLELNARRTGGTHVHEFATRVLGRSYFQSFSILSGTAQLSSPVSYSTLIDTMTRLNLSFSRSQEGILISQTSALQDGVVGYIVVSSSLDRLNILHQSFLDAIL